jgi:membrane-bound metal-dependent hydrolase YbcI (DUF457 family)
MDPLTHSLVGGLAAQTCQVPRRRFWIMVALSNIMDLDIIGNFFGPGASLFYHHGITHSLFGFVFLTLLFSWVLGKWDPGPFKKRMFHYSLPLGLHLIMDLVTHYGIPLLSPFNTREFSLNIVGSLNLMPTLVMGGILGWMLWKQKTGWRATRYVWAFWALYMVIISSGKLYAQKILASESLEIEPIPSLVDPFTWRGLAVDTQAHQYHQVKVNLLNRSFKTVDQIPLPNGDFPVVASRESNLVQSFLEHHKYPVVRYTEASNDGWMVEWGNITFSTRGKVRGKVRVRINSNGEILDEEEIINFWDPV